MATRLRDEFHLRCISLSHPDYSSFAKSKWMSAPLYLVYRWVLAIFITISILLSRTYYDRWYTSFFTGWCLATITIYFDLSAVLCSYQFYKTKHNRSRDISMATENNNRGLEIQRIQYNDELHPGIVWGYKIMWMLFNIAAVNSLIVTIGYWSLLHGVDIMRRSVMGQYDNITAHLLNSLLMLLDAGVSPLPVRLFHVVYSNMYGLLYIAATYIHWLVSGKTAKFYPFLDYHKPRVVVIAIVIGWFVFQPLMQMFFYGVYRFREWLQTRTSRDESTDTATELTIPVEQGVLNTTE